MPAPIPDDKLIAWASEHLYYEAGMLVYAAERLADRLRRDLPSDAESNVLVEAFAIHVRCLDGFFWSDRGGKYKFDAFAVDFCAPGVWKRERGERPPALVEIRKRDRAGREIVHLTYHRLEVPAETKPWQVGALLDEITDALQRFATHALPERLDDETRVALRDLSTAARADATELSSTSTPVSYTGGTIPFRGSSGLASG